MKRDGAAETKGASFSDRVISDDSKPQIRNETCFFRDGETGFKDMSADGMFCGLASGCSFLSKRFHAEPPRLLGSASTRISPAERFASGLRGDLNEGDMRQHDPIVLQKSEGLKVINLPNIMLQVSTQSIVPRNSDTQGISYTLEV